MTNLERFAHSARDFCNWCELRSEEFDPVSEAHRVLELLARLYSSVVVLRLPSDIDYDLEIEHLSDDEAWRACYDRASKLPVDGYAKVFFPIVLPPEEPVIATLADDVADVYRDLSSGFRLYDQGHPAEATWEWLFSFQHHWGRHASSAISALHCWLADRYAWEEL